MNNDLINGLYELVGGFFVLLSCRQVFKDKRVHGVSIWHVLFFLSWGFWNVYYYPEVGQHLSGYGAYGVAIANLIWFLMIVWYKYISPRIAGLVINADDARRLLHAYSVCENEGYDYAGDERLIVRIEKHFDLSRHQDRLHPEQA